ncbi:MAG: hypothetical protein ACREF3_20965 [Acetobacteraceae bacterium]
MIARPGELAVLLPPREPRRLGTLPPIRLRAWQGAALAGVVLLGAGVAAAQTRIAQAQARVAAAA